MYACVIYVRGEVKKIIPTQWIYEETDKIVRKKHYLAYFNNDEETIAPSSELLQLNSSLKLKNGMVHKIYVHKLISKC